MKTVEILKNKEHAGLVKGDVIDLDELSAKNLVDAKEARFLEDDETGDPAEAAEPRKYGGEESRTIDDIHDPAANRHKAVMTVAQVADADPGPRSKSTKTAESTGDKAADTHSKSTAAKARGASGADPAGGDASGGSTS